MSDNARTRPYITTRATFQGRDGILSYVCEPKEINGVPFNLSEDITVPAQGSTLTDPVPISLGGTGATTIEAAQTALELEPGADIQPYASNLDTWSGIAHAPLVDAWIETPSGVNLYSAISAYDAGGVTGEAGPVVFQQGPTLLSPTVEAPIVTGVTYSALPVSIEGVFTGVTDSTTDVPGDIITGSGSKHVLGYYNGTNWVVAAGAKQTNITGNAGTATALQTARNINGQSFDGTADITIPVKSILCVQHIDLTSISAGTYNVSPSWNMVGLGATDDYAFVMPFTCTILSMFVRTGASGQTGTNTVDLTLLKNGTTTGVTVSVDQNGKVTSSATFAAGFGPGDLLSIQMDITGADGLTNIPANIASITMEVQQV